jgi:hypothetical protein
MRPFAIVLSAGVVAGLSVYAVLTAFSALSMVVGDMMSLRIPVFVATLAGTGFGSAALALLFRGLFDRSDRSTLQKLEARLASLEQQPPR